MQRADIFCIEHVYFSLQRLTAYLFFLYTYIIYTEILSYTCLVSVHASLFCFNFFVICISRYWSDCTSRGLDWWFFTYIL